jgi:hypothetical protein
MMKATTLTAELIEVTVINSLVRAWDMKSQYVLEYNAEASPPTQIQVNTGTASAHR